MSTNHDVVTALPISPGSADKTALHNLLVKRMPYALADADNAQTLVETDPDTGAVIIDILYLGRVFHRDDADTTTAHDGVTCLVTAGGKRYKLAAGSDVVVYSVLSRADADPASPSTGDAYLVNAAATGAFASQDNNVAVYTARGWEFVDFGIGRLIYVEDEDVFYRRKTDGSWTRGFGQSALEDGTVAPSAMIGGGGKVFWIVENQTTNVPPAVIDGTAYIVGTAPTGDWAGHTAKIAHGENGEWVIYAPAAGWLAFDKSALQNYQFSGSAWESATGRLNRTIRDYSASATWTKPSRLAYVVVTVVGGGANSGNDGGTSWFGSHCSASGGALLGPAGTGSGGDVNLTGQAGANVGGIGISGVGAGPLAPSGAGAIGDRNGGGGCAIKTILASSLGVTETVTISGSGAANGRVMVEEYTYA